MISNTTNGASEKMTNEPDSRLSIRISPEELKKLKNFAATKNETFADWVRKTLLFQAGIQDDRIAELERRIAALESRLV